MGDGFQNNGFGSATGNFGQTSPPARTLMAPSGYNGNTLVIQQAAGQPNGEQLLVLADSSGNVVFSAAPVGNPSAIARALGSARTSIGPSIILDGTSTPERIATTDQFNSIWGPAAGAPTATIVGATITGDFYWRTDTPGTANQRLYVCTAGGTPGTWVGIL
jgi:hypothetical protein